jgi:hypothetical protein
VLGDLHLLAPSLEACTPMVYARYTPVVCHIRQMYALKHLRDTRATPASASNGPDRRWNTSALAKQFDQSSTRTEPVYKIDRRPCLALPYPHDCRPG